MKRLILTIGTCDNKYLDIIKAYLMSLRINAGQEYTVRAILINGHKEVFDGLKRVYPKLEIEETVLPPGDWTKKENLIRIIRLRPEQMLRALNEGWDQILSLDCDTVVIKPLDSLWEDVVPGSMKIWHRKEKSPQGGVYVLGNSDAMKLFYADYVKSLGTTFALKQGQPLLWAAYRRHAEHIKHIQLDRRYNDEFCDPHSYIWHCKHGNIKTNKRYLKIMCHYFRLAEKLYNAK